MTYAHIFKAHARTGKKFVLVLSEDRSKAGSSCSRRKALELLKHHRSTQNAITPHSTDNRPAGRAFVPA
jgi:hypothetical protein